MVRSTGVAIEDMPHARWYYTLPWAFSIYDEVAYLNGSYYCIKRSNESYQLPIYRDDDGFTVDLRGQTRKYFYKEFRTSSFMIPVVRVIDE